MRNLDEEKQKCINSIVQSIPKNIRDEEKYKLIFDWFIDNCKYDYAILDETRASNLSIDTYSKYRKIIREFASKYEPEEYLRKSKKEQNRELLSFLEENPDMPEELINLKRKEQEYLQNAENFRKGARGYKTGDIFTTKFGVCENFAKAYKELCDRIDLKCEVINGTILSDGIECGHAWNVIVIDGEMKYVDISSAIHCKDGTFIDNVPDDFFNVTTEQLEQIDNGKNRKVTEKSLRKVEEMKRKIELNKENSTKKIKQPLSRGNVNGLKKEKTIDEQIQEAIHDVYPIVLKDLIGISDEVVREIYSSLRNYGKLSVDLLQEILIARDKKVLGLKKCEVSKVKAEDLQLDEEFRNYNADIFPNIGDEKDITIVQGKDKEGKKRILYYYTNDNYNWANRQMRTFNQHGDIESMHRQCIFEDGKYFTDNALIVYKYDRQGNKKAGLYQDDLMGIEYFEYDKEGNILLSIAEDHISQKIQENGNSYMICDGYIDPKIDGFTYKRLPAKISELNIEDMQRAVIGNISQEKRTSISNNMDKKRKEEVLSILISIEPIFQNLFVADVYKYEDETRKSMQKIVEWFTGFAKRLKIDPKLALQDNAVMSTMKRAVGKTIGRIDNVQTELTTFAEEGKKYEGEEYGNN